MEVDDRMRIAPPLIACQEPDGGPRLLDGHLRAEIAAHSLVPVVVVLGGEPADECQAGISKEGAPDGNP
jgi:hypothetical protein